MLPRPDRARFGEEFRGELAELADAGPGWWRMLGYAARQLARAPRLRAELASVKRHRRAIS